MHPHLDISGNGKEENKSNDLWNLQSLVRQVTLKDQVYIQTNVYGLLERHKVSTFYRPVIC